MPMKTTDLYDRFGEAARVLPPVFQDFGGRDSFSGQVVTVKCFEDNSRIKELAATPGRGKVMLVDGGGSLRCALLGDLIAADAVKNGWEGIVIHGCVRDRAALCELPLGIKALAATPRKSLRRSEGQTGLEIVIGGVVCRDGDRLYADEDGVLLLDAAAASELGT
ncbi:MAG: ribonuclease E activity regulator RraA [Steroidobacteraceae bacterium]